MSGTSTPKKPKRDENPKASTNGAKGKTSRGTATIGEYLIERLAALGVGHVFGIPGDYVLTLYKMIEESPIKLVNMTREDNAGFAADAYARIHGLGCICVTYCVGGLSTCNSIAGAYAEKSPVIVLGGSPGVGERGAQPAVAPQGERVRDSARGVPEDHRGVGGPGPAGHGVQRDRPGARGGRAVQAAGLSRAAERPGAGAAGRAASGCPRGFRPVTRRRFAKRLTKPRSCSARRPPAGDPGGRRDPPLRAARRAAHAWPNRPACRSPPRSWARA